jgi:hypothetical protein
MNGTSGRRKLALYERDQTELGVGADAADQCVEQRQLLVELGVEHELEEYSPQIGLGKIKE